MADTDKPLRADMDAALIADGEKLLALTGEDNGPFCVECLGAGWLPANICCGNPVHEECCGNPVMGQDGCDACQGTGRAPVSEQVSA